MKKVICTTTINAPTAALEAFDAMPGWTLIVAGDQKTPKDFKLQHGIYLSPGEQLLKDPALSATIGWNCIQRRNFAFLTAHEMGADIIATVDDDNLPLPGWGEDLLLGREVAVREWQTPLPAFDPVHAAGHPELWHRGFPLPLVAASRTAQQDPAWLRSKVIVPDIQADFWNGDPDVDAVCRMIHAPDCVFSDHRFPFTANKPGPFNSQNTFVTARVLKDYFMFPHVGRMDDIWPSYYVQALGYRVVWNRASVRQVRLPASPGSNPNAGGGGLIANMRAEYAGYEHNLAMVERLAVDKESFWGYVPDRTRHAFNLYQRHFTEEQS